MRDRTIDFRQRERLSPEECPALFGHSPEFFRDLCDAGHVRFHYGEGTGKRKRRYILTDSIREYFAKLDQRDSIERPAVTAPKADMETLYAADPEMQRLLREQAEKRLARAQAQNGACA